MISRLRSSLVVPFLGITKIHVLFLLRVGHPPTLKLAEAGKLPQVIEASIYVHVLNRPILQGKA